VNTIFCRFACNGGFVSTVVNVSLEGASGFVIGAATGIINPVHAAAFTIVNSLLRDITMKIFSNCFNQLCPQAQTWVDIIIKVFFYVVSFFTSAALSSLIMESFGVIITLATALTLSALVTAVWIAIIVSGILLCVLPCMCLTFFA